jgi:hypothetical protein
MQTAEAVVMYACLCWVASLVVGWLCRRRRPLGRCVVCGWRLRRGGRRAWLRVRGMRVAAHVECVVPTDAALRELLERAR